MKIISALKPLAMIAALVTSTFAAANTSTQNFTFTDCLSGCEGNVVPVANLTIEQITNGLSFTLKNTGPAGSFISSFYTAGALGFPENFSEQAFTEYSYSPTFKVSLLTSGNGYNYDFSYQTAATEDRFLSGDTAIWTITGQGVTFDSFVSPLKMMVHVQALSDGLSEKIGAVAVNVAAPVPEPETYAMFLAGLGIMGGIARRRKQK